MSIETVVMYRVVCDRCDAVAGGNEFDNADLFSDQMNAEMAALDMGWALGITDAYWCPDCWDETTDSPKAPL